MLKHNSIELKGLSKEKVRIDWNLGLVKVRGIRDPIATLACIA